MENQPLYNSVIIKTYLEHLLERYPDLNFKELLDYAGISRQEIEDRGHWLTQEQVNRFQEYAAKATANPEIAREAGRRITSPTSSIIIRHALAGFISPPVAYWAIEKVATMVSRHLTIDSRNLADNKIELVAVPRPGVKEESFQCQNRLGMFEAVAELFTGKYATIEHPECLHRGDGHCRYVISWESTKSMIWKRIGLYALLASVPASAAFFYFLPVQQWFVATALGLLLSGGILFIGSLVRNRELESNLQQQGKASEDIIEQINLRYSESLLVREIGEAASSFLDPQQLLVFITDALHKRLHFEHSMVMLANPEKTKLVYSSGHGYTPHEEALLRNVEFSLDNPNSKGYFYRAFVNQRPFEVNGEDEAEANLSEKSYKLMRDLGVTSFICVPIIYKNNPEGILAVDIGKTPRKTTQSNVSLLVGIAQQIGISLNNALAHKKLRESEERFRNLSANSPDIIYQLDSQGAFKYVNPAWEEIFGHRSAELIGKTLSGFITPKGQKAFADVREKILRENARVRDQYFDIVNASGQLHHVTLTGAQDIDAEGKIIGIVGTIKDISKLRGMEAQLLQASKMEAVGTLTGGIAHDFNNIIQAILGYNQLILSSREADAPDIPYLRNINNLIVRARELVKQLLLFSKKVEPLSRIVNINDEIENIHSLLVKSISKMIEIRKDLYQDIYPISADTTQIGQIIMNLVINARDAIGDQNGVITIKTENLILSDESTIGGLQAQAGRYVELSVADTGCGMEADIVKRIFEPFFTTKDPGKGTGLGLSVVQGIVKNHHGFLQCDSRPGKGTAFSIILPAAAEETQEQTAPEKIQSSVFGTEKILLVDDEISILETVKDTLKSFDYRVVTAQSGEEAIDIYRQMQKNIDLVVLDLIMPGCGGKQCLHQLREINPAVKILITSGYADNLTRDLRKIDATGFLEKPYSPEDLLLAIRQLLDGKNYPSDGRSPLHNNKGV